MVYYRTYISADHLSLTLVALLRSLWQEGHTCRLEESDVDAEML